MTKENKVLKEKRKDDSKKVLRKKPEFKIELSETNETKTQAKTSTERSMDV